MMDEPDSTRVTTNNDLRRSLQYAVMQICGKEEEESLSSMTPQAVGALAELTFLYATTSLAKDLDCFSSHANRKSICPDDVKLVARKNPEIRDKLDDFCSKSATTQGAGKSRLKKSGKRPASKAALKENRVPQTSGKYDMPNDTDSSDDMMIDVQKNSPYGSRSNAFPKKPFDRLDDSDESSENEFQSTEPPKAASKSLTDRPIELEDSSMDSLDLGHQKQCHGDEKTNYIAKYDPSESGSDVSLGRGIKKPKEGESTEMVQILNDAMWPSDSDGD